VKPDNGHWDLERLRSTDAPELHRAIDAVKRQLPDAQQLAALAASLSQKGISVTPSQNATATTASSATRLKLLLGAGVVGPLTLALLLWRTPEPHTTAPAVVAPAATPTAQALATEPESSRPIAARSNTVSKLPASSGASDAAPPSAPAPSIAVTDDAPRPSASPAPVRSIPRVAPATPSAESTRSPGAAAAPERASPESIGPGVVARPTEVALLRDARLALGGSPGEALALAEQHRVQFPRGAMVQERELIAISALARLGRHSAVLARAAQFERDFPNSPYRKQVTALAQ